MSHASHDQGNERGQDGGDGLTYLLGHRDGAIQKLLQAGFTPPKKNAPKSTMTSATRNNQRCHPEEPVVQAIAPPKDFGLTSQTHPAITLELTQTSARQVALVIQTEQGKLHSNTVFPIPSVLHLSPMTPDLEQTKAEDPSSKQPHWLSLKLPQTAQPLEAHRLYRWSLVVMCQGSVEPDDPTLSGWIEYYPQVPSSLPVPWKQMDAWARSQWYAQQGYWYDLVESVLAPASEG